MSKASEWVKIKPSEFDTPYFHAYANDTGKLILGGREGNGPDYYSKLDRHGTLNPDMALKLADWIYETFGEGK